MRKKLPTIIIGTLCFLLSLTACSDGKAVPAVSVPDTSTVAATEPQVKLSAISPTLTPLAIGGYSDINLTIPSTFNITRPSDKLTTSYSKYFITGTSDPKNPVYFGGNEIERIGSKGTFGVLVDLSVGANTFTFSQGDKTKTVTITRTSSSAATASISEITQGSMVPSIFAGAKAGETLDVGCVAPSGAEITASFGGNTVRLTQATQANEGVAVIFKGSIKIGTGYESGVTEKIGKVEYTISYNGKSKKYQSTGDVYIAGADSNIAVRVTEYMAFVFPKPDLNELPASGEKLKQGGADFIKSQGNAYVELNSGGFVSKERVKIIEGKVSVGNKLNKVNTSIKGTYESYSFAGSNSPAYRTSISDEKFQITFFNTDGFPQINVSDSRLFSDVSVSGGNGYVTYTFTRGNNTVWGYSVGYNGKNTVLVFHYKPSLSSGSKPLSGLTIALDPGHGGTDNGASGIAADTGPAENDVNLAHAYATRDELEAMGAKVVLTRSSDEFYSLDDRLRDAEALKPDLFVSIHHNSIGENVDANTIKGVEVYYHTSMSKKLADSLMNSVTAELGRNKRFVSQSYYRVTLNPYAPSVLLELGYMSNPLEYERAADMSQIKRAAKAIANGLVASLS